MIPKVGSVGKGMLKLGQRKSFKVTNPVGASYDKAKTDPLKSEVETGHAALGSENPADDITSSNSTPSTSTANSSSDSGDPRSWNAPTYAGSQMRANPPVQRAGYAASGPARGGSFNDNSRVQEIADRVKKLNTRNPLPNNSRRDLEGFSVSSEYIAVQTADIDSASFPSVNHDETDRTKSMKGPEPSATRIRSGSSSEDKATRNNDPMMTSDSSHRAKRSGLNGDGQFRSSGRRSGLIANSRSNSSSSDSSSPGGDTLSDLLRTQSMNAARANPPPPPKRHTAARRPSSHRGQLPEMGNPQPPPPPPPRRRARASKNEEFNMSVNSFFTASSSQVRDSSQRRGSVPNSLSASMPNVCADISFTPLKPKASSFREGDLRSSSSHRLKRSKSSNNLGDGNKADSSKMPAVHEISGASSSDISFVPQKPKASSFREGDLRSSSSHRLKRSKSSNALGDGGKPDSSKMPAVHEISGPFEAAGSSPDITLIPQKPKASSFREEDLRSSISHRLKRSQSSNASGDGSKIDSSKMSAVHEISGPLGGAGASPDLSFIPQKPKASSFREGDLRSSSSHRLKRNPTTSAPNLPSTNTFGDGGKVDSSKISAVHEISGPLDATGSSSNGLRDTPPAPSMYRERRASSSDCPPSFVMKSPADLGQAPEIVQKNASVSPDSHSDNMEDKNVASVSGSKSLLEKIPFLPKGKSANPKAEVQPAASSQEIKSNLPTNDVPQNEQPSRKNQSNNKNDASLTSKHPKYDKSTGRCLKHPSIIVARKKPFGRGWDLIRDGCPRCMDTEATHMSKSKKAPEGSDATKTEDNNGLTFAKSLIRGATDLASRANGRALSRSNGDQQDKGEEQPKGIDEMLAPSTVSKDYSWRNVESDGALKTNSLPNNDDITKGVDELLAPSRSQREYNWRTSVQENSDKNSSQTDGEEHIKGVNDFLSSSRPVQETDKRGANVEPGVGTNGTDERPGEKEKNVTNKKAIKNALNLTDAAGALFEYSLSTNMDNTIPEYPSFAHQPSGRPTGTTRRRSSVEYNKTHHSPTRNEIETNKSQLSGDPPAFLHKDSHRHHSTYQATSSKLKQSVGRNTTAATGNEQGSPPGRVSSRGYDSRSKPAHPKSMSQKIHPDQPRRPSSSRDPKGTHIKQQYRQKSPSNRPAGSRCVAKMPYTTPWGESGWYTGEVNELGVPNGLGRMRFKSGNQYDGQWTNGYSDQFILNNERMKRGFSENRSPWKEGTSNDGSGGVLPRRKHSSAQSGASPQTTNPYQMYSRQHTAPSQPYSSNHFSSHHDESFPQQASNRKSSHGINMALPQKVSQPSLSLEANQWYMGVPSGGLDGP